MKILIVDDAKQTREALYNIIKSKINSDYEIVEAGDGLDALLKVEDFKPDIVLTDILMPNMDGIRLTAMLKSNPSTKHIFVAAITGLSGEDEIKKIYASGVDFYISKPFQLDDIVARLKVITSMITNKSSMPQSKPSIIYNCFKDENIKHYFVTFTISEENDIFLVFDYFTNQAITYNSILLKDFMVTLVKTYRRMDTKDNKFDIIVEESDSYIYFSVKDKPFINAADLLVDKKHTLLEVCRNIDTFTFRINIVSFLTNRTGKKQYENELISAVDLMNVSSDDIDEYITELNDALQEYRALCLSDSRYNESLRLTLINLFDQYTRLFKKVPEFDRVSIALQSIAVLIQDNKRKKFNELQNKDLINHIEELNKTIESWVKSVIINQNSKDVHYGDNKIMSHCRLIEKDFS